jgi:hypothetical protein
MEISILIARIIAVIYISFGIGLLTSRKYYQEQFTKLLNDSTYLILGGILAIIFGFLITEYHNIWTNDWRVVITIIGWVALAKGVWLIAFPKSVLVFEKLFTNTKLLTILIPFVLLFGLFFVYVGFLS